MSLITHWLPIDFSFITNFPAASASNMEKYPFFIEMMFTCKWSYNAGESDSSKRTHKLSPLRHANKAVLSTNTFHFELYIIINFVMITKQLNDNNIAVKMLSLMHIKKLNSVLFSAVAVYLQRKPAWKLECCRSSPLHYMAALQLALSLSCSYNKSTRGMVSGIKKIDKFFCFWPLNWRPFLYLLIIPSKLLVSYSLPVPVSYICIFHVFHFLLLPWASNLLAFKSFAVSFNFSKCFVIKGRMPSGDGVSGIFRMNWWESRVIYLFEGTSFFAIFVSFPWSKLQ